MKQKKWLFLLDAKYVHTSTKSVPFAAKKGSPASPAMALASSVLPVPGGPWRRTPFGQ